MKMKIGISGAQGSFSEEAAREYAKKWLKTRDFEPKYLISAENVLLAVEMGEVDLGVFPIENSSGGIVLEAVYAMAKHRFSIKQIFDIDIRQNLLVKKGVSAQKIKTVTSHEQALKQCKAYLTRKWPKLKRKEYADTAKAAADLAAGVLPATTAVIASRTAAEIYGLDILEANVQDLKTNATTFIAAVK